MRKEIAKRWQETVEVKGRAVRVVVRMRSRNNNFIGYSAEVKSGDQVMKIPMINKLFAEEAQKIALDRFAAKFIT